MTVSPMTRPITSLLLVLISLGGLPPTLSAVDYDPAVLPLLTRPFFHGRDYFVLHSGRTKMIVQADKTDLAPAFLYLLFDADDYRQSKDKDRALNFAGGQGMVNSAVAGRPGRLSVHGPGHQTESRWTTLNNGIGIPTVKAVWWAGGIRVEEQIYGLANENAFCRWAKLYSVNLAGPESVTLRYSLPPGKCTAKDGRLLWETGRFPMALGVLGTWPCRAVAEKGVLEIGPLKIAPGEAVGVATFLATEILPDGKPASRLLHPNLEEWSYQADSKTRDHWNATSSVTTGDALVQDLFNNVRFGLPGMVSDNGVADYGMLEYGSQVVRDASNTMLGLLHLGQFELARAGFEHILNYMVRDQGAAMIDNKFDAPDREELDQMGEPVHALKAYRDWTGDDSLIRQYRAKLLALVERPLGPAFRDASGMVHNRREFWERTLDDGYEAAYQTYLVLGLRDAAELAEPLPPPTAPGAGGPRPTGSCRRCSRIRTARWCATAVSSSGAAGTADG